MPFCTLLLPLFLFLSSQCHTENVLTESKIVCYYATWALYRSSPMSYAVKDIPADICTHVIYSFVGLDEDSWQLKSLDPYHDVTQDGFRSFTNLKKGRPKLKTLLAVGGWEEGAKKYSDMATHGERRKKFVSSVVQWLLKYNFDGFDLDWEYPGSSDRGGLPADKDNFLLLVRELKDALRPHNLILTAAIPLTKYRLEEGFNVRELGRLLDQIHVMSYDLRGNWVGYTDVHSPLYGRPPKSQYFEMANVHDGLISLVEKGAPKDKLVVGIPFYGRTYKLADPNSVEIGAPIVKWAEGGAAGPYTRSAGSLAYYEICYGVKFQNWTKRFDDIGKCPYAYHNDLWVGYEDPYSVGIKVDYIIEHGYGGAMVWSLDTDDFQGVCGGMNPLLNAINDKFQSNHVTASSPTPLPTFPAIIGPFEKLILATESDTQQSTQASLITPEKVVNCGGQHSIYIPDPSNCQIYYWCVFGQPITYICPEGTVWDNKKGICNWRRITRSSC